jgi:hypothetical protein
LPILHRPTLRGPWARPACASGPCRSWRFHLRRSPVGSAVPHVVTAPSSCLVRAPCSALACVRACVRAFGSGQACRALRVCVHRCPCLCAP